jgi:subtilase family serine protease
MTNKVLGMVAGTALFALGTLPVSAAERQVLQGHVPKAVASLNLPATGRLPATTTLQLAIGLPWRNPAGLKNFLQELYTPGHPNFRKYLTPRQFTDQFGPTEEDYQALVAFARTNGLTVTGTFTNRALLDIKASVADIERVFHVTMRVYQHPTEARTFYAPDVEPSLDLALPVLHISGLDNYTLPHRLGQKAVKASGPGGANGTPTPTGSGPGHTYTASNIRTAYVPGLGLTGGGQSVGLLEYEGYYYDLIEDYEAYNGIPVNSVTVENWELDGASGTPGANYGEAQVDIEMAIAMAPGLDSVIVYELPSTTNNPPPDDALNFMAAQDLANQLSSSYGFEYSANTDEIFQELAAQGQSFFQSSGDAGALPSQYIPQPYDDPYITLVGGTELTTGSGGAYSSETVLNDTSVYGPNGDGILSAGGISDEYAIPWYQEGINMSGNGGSTTMRNMPDVAIVADSIYAFYSETGTNAGPYLGTSLAAPLWAGFMALANEQAQNDGLPAVGFANPVIYAIGKGSSYNSCFHDITTGNNETPYSPNEFSAVTCYDLCTGWGTPKGQALINALVSPPPSLVWVQFSAAAGGNGTWLHPYNTMAAGVSAVPANGAIWIKGPGSSTETPTITKPMSVRAVGGAATIGN